VPFLAETREDKRWSKKEKGKKKGKKKIRRRARDKEVLLKKGKKGRNPVEIKTTLQCCPEGGGDLGGRKHQLTRLL